MKTLYALLVGINDYPKPLKKLKGCLKDVALLEGILEDFFQEELSIKVEKLVDQEARYENIIMGFREHLRKAGPDDVAWFHFSGHGSEQPSATEFLELEPNGKDQTLICIDSRLEGGLHLADKELAVLLHEVATQNQNGQSKESPHIVVSLDCCHSGSGTRSIAEPETMGTRATIPTKERRSFSTYLDGYYEQQKSTLQIPMSQHVLLSACESVQRAGDLSSGGAFTTGLTDALRSAKGKLNYSDLFIRTRSYVRKIRRNQTPQFETLGSFDPYRRFLEGSDFGTPDRYEVHKDGDDWFVRCGAIHGLPTDLKSPIEIEIQGPAPDYIRLGRAEIVSVGAQQSKIDFGTGFEIKRFLKGFVEEDNQYLAVLKHLPAPQEFVRLAGAAEDLRILQNKWDTSKNVIWTTEELPDDQATLAVEATDAGFEVRDLTKQKTAYKTDGKDEGEVNQLIDALGRIVTWRRTISLSNHSNTSQMRNLAELEVEVLDKQNNPITYTGKEIKLFATEDNSRGGKFGFKPWVLFKHIDQNLYFYLLHLRPEYSIECLEDVWVYRPEEHPESKEIRKPLWTKPQGWGLSSDDKEATLYLKLIVTSEPLDHQQLLQSGIRTRGEKGATRDDFGSWDSAKIADDWQSITMRINVDRQIDEIGTDQEIELLDGQVKIKPHGGIRAKVSLGTADSSSRSLDPSAKFGELDGEVLHLMGLSSDRDESNLRVLELQNVDVDSTTNMEEDPLEIILSEQTGDDEMLLPLAFDGTNFQVVGDAESSGEETVVRVHHLPALESESEDNGEEEISQDRSVFSAVKLAFFKVVLKQEDWAFRLRWTKLGEDAKFQREEIKPQIKEASNILLLVHGLMGDSDSMMKQVEDATSTRSSDFLNQYDLVLGFDDETLNTGIDESAFKLKELLQEAGISESDDQQVTVLAHSIGGLVARWFVEKEGGNSMVDRLILIGTPNKGSGFGKIDSIRNFATTLLELAVNFSPIQIPGSAYLVKYLQKTGEMTKTLGQISPTSDFLKKLNSAPDPHIPYTMIGGDVSNYEVQGGGFQRMVANTRKKLVTWVNQDETHDFFVGTRSTLHEDVWEDRIPKPIRVAPISCHHMNYLESEAGWEALNEVLK